MSLVVLAAGRVDLAAAMSVAPNPVTLDAPATWTLTIHNRAAQAGANGVSLEAVFVGDSPFHDVGGAQAVGMRTVLTTQYVTRPTEGMPAADATISHVRELAGVVADW